MFSWINLYLEGENYSLTKYQLYVICDVIPFKVPLLFS